MCRYAVTITTETECIFLYNEKAVIRDYHAAPDSGSGRGPDGYMYEMEDKMRRYEDETNTGLTEVVCNQCKKKLKVENGYLKEGCLTVDTMFGYFSKKDGMRHRFDLCEECYDKMISHFQIPVEESEVKELL